MKLLGYVLILSLASTAAVAQVDRTAGVRLATERAQHLRHGINASEWFAQSPHDYSAARTGRFTDDADLALMAKLGFDNVRLSIDPVPLTAWPQNAEGFNAEFLARVDHVVDTLTGEGLAVEVDIHPEGAFKQALKSGNEGADQLVGLWRHLAAHYANRNPDLIFFEVMNEPEQSDAYRWAGIEARVVAAIRNAAPRQTIIATGAGWSDIADLLALTPFADGNVIYNFHFYDPHTFTHQGAGWGVSWWRQTHDLPYPPTAESMNDRLKQLSDPVERLDMQQYWLDNWNGQRIRQMIDAAAAWGKANGVPLICNEFGAYREHMDAASRMRWIADVRQALEADGIGWTMWDYRGGFGVVHKQDGQPAVVDEAVVAALGLRR